jgi:hypothetical protein
VRPRHTFRIGHPQSPRDRPAFIRHLAIDERSTSTQHTRQIQANVLGRSEAFEILSDYIYAVRHADAACRRWRRFHREWSASTMS